MSEVLAEARAKAADPEWDPPRWVMHMVAFGWHPVRYARYLARGVKHAWRNRP